MAGRALVGIGQNKLVVASGVPLETRANWKRRARRGYPRTLRRRSSARWRRTVLSSFQTTMAWVMASGSNSHGTMSSS